MPQKELINIVKQLNHVDLEGEAKDDLTAKVLQMAADSVTLEMLKGLLAPNKSNAAPVQGETAKTLGRKSKPGFTLSKKEIKSMPEKYRKYLPAKTGLFRTAFIKGCTKRITAETDSKCLPAQRISTRCAKNLLPNFWIR